MAEKKKHIRVRNYAHEGYRRGGVAHAKGETVHAPDAFSDAQVAQMQADKNLAVQFVDPPKAEPAAS